MRRRGRRVALGRRPGPRRDPLRRLRRAGQVPADQALPLPEALSFEQGAAFPVNYGTAYAALVIMGGLKRDERVLIHAAAGGVGIAATQIAKRIGAEVFGTASPAKHDAIRAQGVEHPIDYRNADFADEAMRITGGVGLDLIIDAVGPSSFRKDYAILRAGGRLVMYGLSEVQTGDKRDLPAVLRGLARMPLATMPWWKSLQVMNENKGVFGLNMLKWWDAEGLDRVARTARRGARAWRVRPRRRRGVPVRPRRRRAPVHRRAPQRRQGRSHALATSAGAAGADTVREWSRSSPPSAASSIARSSTADGCRRSCSSSPCSAPSASSAPAPG